MPALLFKCTFVSGLLDIVTNEISQQHPYVRIINSTDTELFITTASVNQLRQLKSVTAIYVVQCGEKLNPHYISNHKSILGNLIEYTLGESIDTFRTFRLSCAGADSPEAQEIHHYISNHFKLTPADDADMDIAIGKIHSIWEVSVRLTARPLSLRNYRVANIPGGMNPTIAYAMNTLCNLTTAQSYLNVCSGSATLLIEAGLMKPSLRLVGFDIDGRTNALAIQNIKKAGLVRSIHLKTADLHNRPDLGTFDVITCDLPFGMQVSKGTDLDALYQSFIDYCADALNPNGIIAVYTAEHELFERLLQHSPFHIIKSLSLRLPTIVGAYMYTKIFILRKR